MENLENLTKEIKQLKQLQAKFYLPIFDKYKDTINFIKDTYKLNELEIAYSLKLDIPLEEHKCKVCGKHVGFSLKYKKFNSYCNNICKAKDVTIKNKRLNTLKERYGTSSIMDIPEFRSKIDNTNLKKFGNKNYFASDAFANTRKNNLYNLNIQCRDKGYNSILEKCKTANLVPLFTHEEYLNNEKAKYNRLLKWKCLDCGKTFEDYYANGILPICSCHKVKHSMQNEVEEYIISLLGTDIEIKRDSRSVISPYEIDIFIPSLNIGIEFDGKYWHSSEVLPRDYHLNKTKLCEEKGIHLIHIFEWEWDNPVTKELVKKRLKNLLDKKQNKIFARKCIVKEIDTDLAKVFIEEYHLQGYCSATIKLGLFYNNELVSVMTFGKPRFNNKYQYELLRFCSKYPVIGGASKLLVYFEKNFKPNSLISYANRCWSSKLDNVYEKIGFKLIDESDPGYVYVSKIGNKVLTRYQCQKHKLKDVLGEDKFDINKTELQNMLDNNFLRIFDCGQLVFEKTYDVVE